MRTPSWLIFVYLLSFHCNVFSDGGAVTAVADGDKCNNAFSGSRLYYSKKAVEKHANDKDVHPKFTDISEERDQVKHWNKPPPRVPNRVMRPFPEDVHPINHQLPRPANATTVKLGEAGDTALMARAYYSYDGRRFGTNVTFSSRAVANNLMNMKKPGSKNWLVGEDAVAAILYLHGGGTKSTGGHTAEGLINHYKDFKVDVVALDLPWHAEGHREMLPSLEAEIKALSAFVQKYIPSHVPLFVWGHSWGAVWAEYLMRMTDRPHSEFSFHHSLTGVMIMAPAMDAARGQSMWDKIKAYQKRIKHAMENLTHLFAPREQHFQRQMVEQGKISPTSSLVTMLSIIGLDQRLPEHKGEKYIEGVAVVGEGDSLVRLGFEDLFDVYNQLVNVEFHLLSELPVKDANPSKLVRVGHLLRDYVFPGTQTPIDIKIASDFIARKLGVEKLKKQGTDTPNPGYISFVQEYFNNLAFREYEAERNYYIARGTEVHGRLKQKKAKISKDVHIAFEHYHSMPIRIQYALEQLVASKSAQEYKEALEEIQTLLQPDFIHRLSNRIVTRELRTFNDVINWTNSDGLYHYNLENNQAQAVRQWAAGVLNNEKLKNFFTKKTSGKRMPLLVRRIVESPDLETATALVKAEQLPERVDRLVLAKLKEMFTVIDMINGFYVPTFEFVQRISMFDVADKDRIETRISGIRNNVEQRQVLQADIKTTVEQLRQLKEDNMDLIKDVRHYIRIIKVAFEMSNREPPDSLKENVAESNAELDRLVNNSDTLNEAIENTLRADVLRDGETVSLSAFNEIISKHAEAMNAFMKQYESFATNRRHLRRNLIVAIERGEMGEEFKEAVLQIYGTGSGGHRPLVGTNSVYLKLEKNMESMAELEAKLYQMNTNLHELNVHYQGLFTSLLQLIRLHDNDADIAKVPHVYIYYSDSIRQLLTRPAALDELSAQEQREEHLDYVRNNERDFQQINKDWRKEMKSDLSPLLPTDAAVEL